MSMKRTCAMVGFASANSCTCVYVSAFGRRFPLIADRRILLHRSLRDASMRIGTEL
jgi:hypothetical protein